MRFTLFAIAALTGNAVAKYIRCGTADPSKEHKAELNAAVAQASESKEFSVQASRNVNLYVHIVVASTAEKSKYPQSMVNQQVSVMNQEYARMNVNFVLRSTDYTVNSAWASAQPGSQTEYNMKNALRQGSYADLNLYLLSNLGGGLLGVCYFPVARPTTQDRVLDGCLVLAGSMPGGEATNYDEGYTAVHEVGHWFGLYHVFQGESCSGSGDYVSDTPIQKTITSGCPSSQDSCPGSAGVDSIHNFMDYSYDSCMYEFTSGQISRATSTYDSMRAGK